MWFGDVVCVCVVVCCCLLLWCVVVSCRRCSWFVVRGLLFVVRCSLSAVCCAYMFIVVNVIAGCCLLLIV